jgi:hypothetical protein
MASSAVIRAPTRSSKCPAPETRNQTRTITGPNELTPFLLYSRYSSE